MANIDGLIGYNSPSGVDKLFAAYGNDIVDVSTGLGYGLNRIAGNKAQFEAFIDRIFYADGNQFLSFGEGAWSKSIGLPKQIIPKYLKKSVNNAQLLIGNVVLTPGSGTPINYKSYVFKSNFPSLSKSPSGGVLSQNVEWGIESGRCTIQQDLRKVKAVPDGNGRMPYFKTRGIRVGDPFFLLGGDIGQYTVAAIPSEYELILNETIPSSTNTNIDFWVGRNYFPVGTDDNDEIMGFGENSGRDLIFKLFSLWFYTGTQLKQIKGALGTSSQRSVINDQTGNTYYFHGSDLLKTGIYKYDGVGSKKISRAIDPYIRGMNSNMFPEIVAWEEGDELRFYLGDISNNNENISMTNAVASLNTATGAWDVSPIKDVIKCSTKWIVNNIQNAYCGTDDNQVLKMGVGNDYNGKAIPLVLETGVYYPSGSEIQNDYPWIQVIGKNAKGIRFSYKLWDQPTGVDDRWNPLGELREDKTEFAADKMNRLMGRPSSGIQFRFEEDGSMDNNYLIEKISVFYRPDRTRLL